MAHWIPWDEAKRVAKRGDSTLYAWERDRGLRTWKEWDAGEKRWLRFVDEDSLLEILPGARPGRLRKF